MNSKNVRLHPTLSKMISEYFLNWMNLRKFAATALLLHICCTRGRFFEFWLCIEKSDYQNPWNIKLKQIKYFIIA